MILSSEPSCETDEYLYAKACFDARLFHQSANILANCIEERSVFLRIYASILAAESQQPILASSMSERPMADGALKRSYTALLTELERISSNHKLDGFLLFLYGILQKKLGMREKAIDTLVRSICVYPFNWSTWMQLSSCLHQPSEVKPVEERLPDDIMTSCFHIVTSHQLGHLHWKSLMKMADQIEKRAYKMDQYAVEGIDVYSNTLFLLDRKAELAGLAHHFMSIYKYRPETHVVLGNYYSSISNHPQAIEAFERVIKLDPLYAPAWTLLGHEYVENHALDTAIQVYRRAVDINPCDYRAWFGLAQAYGSMNLPSFAVQYTLRAISLRPEDSRLWKLLSNNYRALKRPYDAIKAAKRTILLNRSADVGDILMLADLHLDAYESIGDPDLRHGAAYYYEKFIKDAENCEQMPIEGAERAYLFMIEYKRSIGDLESANDFEERLGNHYE
eukprot:jgi/Hompol1/6965/HPOL_000868-RA